MATCLVECNPDQIAVVTGQVQRFIESFTYNCDCHPVYEGGTDLTRYFHEVYTDSTHICDLDMDDKCRLIVDFGDEVDVNRVPECDSRNLMSHISDCCAQIVHVLAMGIVGELLGRLKMVIDKYEFGECILRDHGNPYSNQPHIDEEYLDEFSGIKYRYSTAEGYTFDLDHMATLHFIKYKC